MLYGKRLKNLRERNGITQEQLGLLIGVTKQAYHHFEVEYTIIPLKHLNDLCNYFGVSLDYIFEFNNINQYQNSICEINLEMVKNRLKEFRKENKLSQVKLSFLLNVAKGTIGNYETARSLIATPFLYTICKKYHISADYLLGKVDSPKYLK
ncbi:dNA-binding helix-turn-helix protein [Mycoplasma sp. CAG:776]|nr:dNA-binding helix-turn-helix protein [Mycoplasma sp. CAG:776]